MTVNKFVDNNTTAYRIWQSFQTDIHSTCTEQVTSLYNRINTLRLYLDVRDCTDQFIEA